MARRLGAVAVAAFAVVGTAVAQTGQDEWQATLDRAKGQTLVAIHAAERPIDPIFAEFTRTFGIKVEATVARPSPAFARIRTEQQNGQYLWDIWWGGGSNMSINAAPLNMLEKIEPFFILPEVKDAAQWRHPDYIFGDAGRHTFTYINLVNYAIFRNTGVLPEVKVDTPEALLDPRLKGRISMREASTPNVSTFTLAIVLKEKGPDFLRRFLKDQAPKTYENAQQLLADVSRGGQAIAIGINAPIYEQCRRDGGCRNVEPMKRFSTAFSIGVAVPNPPHKDAVKVWLNWFLSREGQSVMVREWAKYNVGAVSMRKDVPPAPGHEEYLPDFAHPDQYVWVSTDKGEAQVAATIKIYNEVARR